jgi:hypothetical protein
MEALADLRLIGQIKSAAWDDVIDVPRPAVILHAHARFELSLDVFDEYLELASDKSFGAIWFS